MVPAAKILVVDVEQHPKGRRPLPATRRFRGRLGRVTVVILLRAEPRGTGRRSRSPIQVRACRRSLPHAFERSYKGEKSRTREGTEGNCEAGLGPAIARGHT